MTAEVRAAGLVIRQGERIVLVRERLHHGGEVWNIPGGLVDRGETYARAAVREALEECGIEVEEPLTRAFSVQFMVGETAGWAVTFEARAKGERFAIDDPDGMVQEARWVTLAEAEELLSSQTFPPRREPVIAYLRGEIPSPEHWRWVDFDTAAVRGTIPPELLAEDHEVDPAPYAVTTGAPADPGVMADPAQHLQEPEVDIATDPTAPESPHQW